MNGIAQLPGAAATSSRNSDAAIPHTLACRLETRVQACITSHHSLQRVFLPYTITPANTDRATERLITGESRNPPSQVSFASGDDTGFPMHDMLDKATAVREHNCGNSPSHRFDRGIAERLLGS